MKKNILIITVILIGIIIFVQYIGTKDIPAEQSQKTQKSSVVEIKEIKTGKIDKIIEVTGSVEPYHEASLASLAEGPVEKINVREGDNVKAGQEIIIIGRKHGIDALISSLEEDVRKELSNLERTEHLFTNNVVPIEKVEIAKASYEKANAALVRAKEQSEDYIVKAPWNGVVRDINVREGEFSNPRQILAKIYEPESLVVKSTVYESQAMEIKEDMDVNIQLDAYPDRKLSGKIRKVFPYLDPRLRTRPFEVIINEDVSLLPGMFARLSIITETKKGVVVIPVSSVLYDRSQNPFVFIFQEGKSVMRKIRTGIEYKDRVEVIQGISAGESIIVKGMDELKDGMQVRTSQNPQKGVQK